MKPDTEMPLRDQLVTAIQVFEEKFQCMPAAWLLSHGDINSMRTNADIQWGPLLDLPEYILGIPCFSTGTHDSMLISDPQYARFALVDDLITTKQIMELQ